MTAKHDPDQDPYCLDPAHDELAAEVSTLTAENERLRERLTEAEATIVRAQRELTVEHPVWLVLDDYDGSMDSVKAFVAERDEADRQRSLVIESLIKVVEQRDGLLRKERDELVRRVLARHHSITTLCAADEYELRRAVDAYETAREGKDG